MGSSKKKEKDRKKKKRERSKSRDRDRHRHRHKHKKHKRAREERSPSISLSDISDVDTEFDLKKAGSKYSGEHFEPQTAKNQFNESSNLKNQRYEPLSYKDQRYESPNSKNQYYDSPASQSQSYETSMPKSQRQEPNIPTNQRPKSPSFSSNGSVNTSKEVSLSIGETNKIRAKLGLKPLQGSAEPKEFLVSGNTDGEKGNESEYKLGEFVHKPAENLRDKIQVEKLREKIAAQREKRRLKEKLGKVKGLGNSDEEEADTVSWVKKTRKLEAERTEAEKRNKMLEELDAQFGIGDLVEEEISNTKRRVYGSENLSGMRVQHDMERFAEGQTVLTLKDSNILGGEEDTLVNVNIEDTERTERKLKMRIAKDYEPDFDAPSVDDFGNFVQNNLLSKYDDEILGEKKQSFRIGNRGYGAVLDDPVGTSEADGQSKMSKLRKLTTLSMPESQLATEYMTPSDMVSFKKVKRKKKKKKILKADDLMPIDDAEAHFGSRNFRQICVEDGMDGVEDGEIEVERVKSLRELMEEDDDLNKEESLDISVMNADGQDEKSDTENNDYIELQEALERSRRAKLNAQRNKASAEAMSDNLKVSEKGGSKKISDNQIDLNDPRLTVDSSMTLNLTDEFCRSLGEIPTYGLSGNRADEDAIQIAPNSSPKNSENWDATGAWEEVDIEDTKVEILNDKNAPILEEEPDTAKGVVNALKLAYKKGYLEQENMNKPVNATLQHLRAVHYSIEDKAVDEERRGRGNDRYCGPTIDFREKDSYRPEVKLEYVDDEGRKLCAKEAFRYLSHKFHGKGSGKNKLEKRMKKWQEELLMKQMSSNDTPLQTLERQREKQKQLGAAFLVLSGNKPQESMDIKK